ncbi:MAG TPA: threonine synthase [Planctomycetes bacterium]|nr:threonine synthase [Planctomycetota bacterium]
MGALSHLECGLCGKQHDAFALQGLSTCCGKPLLARYDLKAAAVSLTKEALRHRLPDMWRWAEILPVADPTHRVALGEGGTPLVEVPGLGAALGIPRLAVKDEAQNPTGSFKARGLGMAVSRAKELGVKVLAIPSAGNAAGAAAAYGVAAGMTVKVFMPADAPRPFRIECETLGAEVVLIDGLITDCGHAVKEGVEREGWFPLSTLKEPYRLEGKKTLGLELAEQGDWTLPDVIVYPTGGGTGLIGMWKAFDELEAMGWIGAERPRLVSVQSAGCAPIVRAFEEGAEFARPWEGAATLAAGLRVPAAVGDFLILRAIRETQGCAVAVPDEEIADAVQLMARTSGLYACPEGGACAAAARRLKNDGWIDEAERIVLFNTGTPFKYL